MIKQKTKFEKLKNLIGDRLDLLNLNEVTMKANFSKDLGADSLDIAELVIHCEKEFDIRVDDEYVVYLKTVGDLLFYIENYEPTKNNTNKQKFKKE